MDAINAVTRTFTHLLMAPFLATPWWLGLVVWALVFGALAAMAFRFTSNQSALKRVSNEITASLLAMRLFNEDMLVAFKSQGRLLRASGLRLWHSLPPLIVLIVPFMLLLAQLAMYYQFEPARPAAAAAPPNALRLVELSVRPDAWEQCADLELSAPDGVQVDARVRDAAKGVITWRLRPLRESGPAPFKLAWKLPGGGVLEKDFVVRQDRDALLYVSPKRPGSFGDALLYPGEAGFPKDSPVRAVSIDYPWRSGAWVVIFLVVSIIGAFAMKPFMKVQF